MTRKRAVPRVLSPVGTVKRTKDSFINECNINNIMRKFEKHGALEHARQTQGQYGDFTETPQSYHDALNQVIAADEMFLTVPAKIRLRFNNDPQEFLDFVENSDNADELIEMGLAHPKAIREGIEASQEPVGDPPAPEPPAEP